MSGLCHVYMPDILMDAVEAGDEAALRARLSTTEGRAELEADDGGAICTAATKGHTACVELLLEASADPDRVPGCGPTGEPPGDSALQHAAAEGYLVRCRRHVRFTYVA